MDWSRARQCRSGWAQETESRRISSSSERFEKDRYHPVVGVPKRDSLHSAQARKGDVGSLSKNQSRHLPFESVIVDERRRHLSTHRRSLVAVCAEICRRSEISEVALATHK